jgi:hypothetical protein
MAGAKIVVLYPTPPDVDAFERAYTQDHVPMVTPATFKGMVKFIASISSGGRPVFLVAEEETRTF